jgi:hypothetical protein
MRNALKWMLICGLLMSFGAAFAAIPVGSLNITPNTESGRRSLDDPCTVHFNGFIFGSYSGAIQWPGGSVTFYQSGDVFTNTCTPDETFTAFCVDIDHYLNQGSYCANITPVSVRADYPEQTRGMAYLMAWYPPANAASDRLLQVSLWKMASDQRTGATHGVPWYHINAGRGDPEASDTPRYPYVNTVYNTDHAQNVAANGLVRLALGASDGIPKNVALCDDRFELTRGPLIPSGDNVMIEVTIHLIRGETAPTVNNSALAGVQFAVSSEGGSVSPTTVWTNSDGIAHVVITQARTNPVGTILHVCTKGIWLKSVVPCPGTASQQLLVAGPRCEMCLNLSIPPDQWEPTELASFDAAAANDGIALNWRSSAETSVDHWEIERAEGQSAFQSIASMQAANVTTGHEYHFVDQSVQSGVSYSYRLTSVDLGGARRVYTDVVRTASVTTSSASTLSGFQLVGNYPNPFNPTTSIVFNLAEAAHTTLKVYDITGKEVATLLNGNLSAGAHTVNFAGSSLPSGNYFYTLTSGSFSSTKKMTLMK